MMTLAAFAVMTAILISASVHDIRSREVPDIHWVAVCAVGLVMMIIAMADNVTAQRVMIFIGSVLIVTDILLDAERPPKSDVIAYAAIAAMFIIPAVTSADDSFVLHSMPIPICYVVFAAMFFTGIIKGGADVKCLISLAVIFPVYPAMYGYPMTEAATDLVAVIISFPLTVLLYASLISVLAAIPIMIRNVRRGDKKVPNMFLGYRMDADAAGKAHVWPMDADAMPDGEGKIWVTPKIPFIVPITASVIITVVVGNVLFLI